jgi:hypothetical protein
MAGLRKRGNAPGLIRQPGSKLSYKQDGTIQGSIVYEGDASARAAAPKINSSHPDDSRAICYDVEIENLKSGKIRATAAYIGVTADPTPWFLSGTGSLDKESIVTHPDFVAKIGGTAASPKNGAKFDDDTKEFLGFPADADGALGGVDSYFVPSVVYRFTRWTYRQPDFGDLGKIQTPPVAIRKPASVRDFLLGSGTYHQVGNLYQETMEFWGSGPRGWNRMIYSR